MTQLLNIHLAELNMGRLLSPTDDPLLAEFFGARDLKEAQLWKSHGCAQMAAE
jgi:hypothetical protein